MKYLYKSMENLSETNGNVVLGWHEKVSSAQPRLLCTIDRTARDRLSVELR